MTSDEKTPEGFSLKRWSRVKRDAKRAPARPLATEPPLSVAPATETAVPAIETVVAANEAVVPANEAVVPANAGTQCLSPNVPGFPPVRGRQESVTAARATTAGATPTSEVALPPIESLTIDSDFTAFLQPKVDEALKRRALKKLFGDPHFNVMDRLDVYIDDYSQPDPLAPEIARQLVQARMILDARPTRINAQGILEDVPPAEGESPAGKVAQDGAPAEPPTAGPTALPVPGAPEVDAVSSVPAIEQVASGGAAREGDPNDPADPR